MEMYTSGQAGYVAEKAEATAGWVFPVGDEPGALGYVDMFSDMFNAIDERRRPREDFYDGCVVNAIIDAAYVSAKSKRWEPVKLTQWRAGECTQSAMGSRDYDAEHLLIKQERMLDGTTKLILRHKVSGQIIQRIERV
jgi:hypothetical protein